MRTIKEDEARTTAYLQRNNDTSKNFAYWYMLGKQQALRDVISGKYEDVPSCIELNTSLKQQGQ